MRIGLLGCGNVGGALVELVADRTAAIQAATGHEITVARIAVRSTTKSRSKLVDASLLTTDAAAVVASNDVDIVVEVIGGIEPARTLILEAFKHGKPVVTGNKELLANCGPELYAAAEAAGVDLGFEAAVAGAIPIMGPLRMSLQGERITRIMGIVNGTTNYILTQMAEEGASYGDALAEAQRLGYAEGDPTADVEGFDAGAKAAIMAAIAFDAKVVAGDVYHEGISAISAADISYANKLGYEIKLLAIAEHFESKPGEQRGIGVRVHPAMVPCNHPLASVRGSFNAVFVEGAAAGELMFYGRGAGGMPTASAVLGDILEAASNLRRGTHRSIPTGEPVHMVPIDDLPTAFYLNVEVSDAPGVLAQVAGALGDQGVSIRTMEQEGLGDDARIALITHAAPERPLRLALGTIEGLAAVKKILSVIRVIGTDG